jgi:hypothetical protein
MIAVVPDARWKDSGFKSLPRKRFLHNYAAKLLVVGPTATFRLDKPHQLTTDMREGFGDAIITATRLFVVRRLE